MTNNAGAFAPAPFNPTNTMKKTITILLCLFVTSACSNVDKPGVSDPNDSPEVGACCTEKGECTETTIEVCQGKGLLDFRPEKTCNADILANCRQLAEREEKSDSPEEPVYCCVDGGTCLRASDSKQCNEEYSGSAYANRKDCESNCNKEKTSDPPEEPKEVACCTDLAGEICKIKEKNSCLYIAKDESSCTDQCNPNEELTHCYLEGICKSASFEDCIEQDGIPYSAMAYCLPNEKEVGDTTCDIKGKCIEFEQGAAGREHCEKIGGTAYADMKACRRFARTHACCMSQQCHSDLLPEECERQGGFVHSGGEKGVGCNAAVQKQCKQMTTEGACCTKDGCEQRSEWGCSDRGVFYEGESCGNVNCSGG